MTRITAPATITTSSTTSPIRIVLRRMSHPQSKSTAEVEAGMELQEVDVGGRTRNQLTSARSAHRPAFVAPVSARARQESSPRLRVIRVQIRLQLRSSPVARTLDGHEDGSDPA